MQLQENECGVLSLYTTFCVRIVSEDKLPKSTAFCVVFLRLFNQMIYCVRTSCNPIPGLKLGQLWESAKCVNAQ
jgi:hypothetical protein